MLLRGKCTACINTRLNVLCMLDVYCILVVALEYNKNTLKKIWYTTTRASLFAKPLMLYLSSSFRLLEQFWWAEEVETPASTWQLRAQEEHNTISTFANHFSLCPDTVPPLSSTFNTCIINSLGNDHKSPTVSIIFFLLLIC